jgi:RNA polymerase sigma factor (sigma-70 family)
MSLNDACPSLCEVEARFEALRELAAAGASYAEAEAQVLAFLRHPALAGLCRMAAWRTTAQAQDHADLMQAALLALLEKLRDGFGREGPLLSFRPEAGGGKHPFTGWLYTVLLNACRSAHRPAAKYAARVGGRRSLLAGVAARPDTDQAPERSMALARAIEGLPDGPRRVLLGLLAGQSGNEIAEQAGKSAVWVSRQKARGIELLRRALNPGEGA